MVSGMSPGSVIVDIAAERGGNCELTRPDEVVVRNDVTILGPVNLPSMLPYHASQMFSANLAALAQYLVRDGRLFLDLNDEIVRETLVTHQGKVVHPRVGDLLSASQVSGQVNA
jgi:H+-translocating NAD(P) transhydrogenase subunit alpha